VGNQWESGEINATHKLKIKYKISNAAFYNAGKREISTS
jgi:hypothetical protein